MAKQTYIDRMKKLDADYRVKMTALREEMGGDFGKQVAPLIPDGWTLTWEQSDSQYNDEDYHFGLETFSIKKGRTEVFFGHLNGDGPDCYIGDKLPSDVTMEQLTELFQALDTIREKTYRETFGDCAEVSIASDGSCSIKVIPSRR